MKTEQRNSGLELLRIVAILMIICIHAFGLVQGVKVNWIGKETTRIVNCICNMGVSCFVLISGYFGVKRDWIKIIRLEMIVIFLSFCTTLLLAIAFPEIYCGSELLELIIKSCIPMISRKHWFYTCYICLLLLSPWINEMLEKMTKRQFEGLLLSLLFLFSIFPTFLYFEIMQDGGKGLVNMILVYVLGRYIRKYGDFKICKGKALLVFCGLLGLSYISSFYWFTIGGIHHSFIKDNSIVNIGMAVILLYLFKDMNCRTKWVNRISAHVFGIYILNLPVMQCIHTYILKTDEARVNTNYFPLWMVLEIGVTFLICLLCDILRSIMFGKLEEKILFLIKRAGSGIDFSILELGGKKVVNFLKSSEKEESGKSRKDQKD